MSSPPPGREGHGPLWSALCTADTHAGEDRAANKHEVELWRRLRWPKMRPEDLVTCDLVVPPIEAAWDTPRGRCDRSVLDPLFARILDANACVREATDVGFVAAARELQAAVDALFATASTAAR